MTDPIPGPEFDAPLPAPEPAAPGLDSEIVEPTNPPVESVNEPGAPGPSHLGTGEGSAPPHPPSDQPQIPGAPDPSHLGTGEGTAPPHPPSDQPPRTWEIPSQPPRIPHLGHVALLGLLFLFGLAASAMVAGLAVGFHLFGFHSLKDAIADVRFVLLAQAALEVTPFLFALLLFPPLWECGFFQGIQWNFRTTRRLWRPLLGASFLCFVLALVNSALMPGPTDAPIDKMLQTPGAAWLMAGFGVFLAPFFEELAFRGFLLPALCTAFDWTIERQLHLAPRPLDARGHPQWSVPAMIAGSIATSLPFALMHAEQTAHAAGPFVLLIGVSLVLCLTRLRTRSLAASVLVHASYNFLLFALMFAGTGGFRHLDKM